MRRRSAQAVDKQYVLSFSIFKNLLSSESGAKTGYFWTDLFDTKKKNSLASVTLIKFAFISHVDQIRLH